MSVLEFTKMHGLGNDFMVVDNLDGRHRFEPLRIRALADRHTGVGFDQLLLIEPPACESSDFTYRIFNADGQEVEHCGNGARCFARYVYDRKLTGKRHMRVDTAAGQILLQLTDDGEVRVEMGVPQFDPPRVPFIADHTASEYCIDVDGLSVVAGVVAIGNPHLTIRVEDIDAAPVETLGPALESHERFPRRVNVGFMQILTRSHIALRVYERGVGETRACGSGACAAVSIGHRQGLIASACRVTLPGGDLQIDWPAPDEPIAMTGPCSTVFLGQLEM